MSDSNLDEQDSAGGVEQSAQDEEEQVIEDQTEQDEGDFEPGADDPYTEDDQVVEEKRQQQQKPKPIQQQSQQQDIPGERLSRQQKRMAERQQAKPTQQQQSKHDRRIRMPQEAPVETGMESYSEVENPSAQILPPGVEPSRAEQLFMAGELQGIGRKALLKAASRMQAYRTAFIEWQAQREDYKIFQNMGTDPDTGNDIWESVTYRLHFLTMGQDEKLRDMNAVLDDYRRAAVNNDTTVKDVNKKIRKLQKQILRYKLRTYFRMYISEPDPETGAITDPDDELQRASSVDVRDMLDSAEWCFQWVPKSRRIKPSEVSGSKTETEYGIQ